MWEIMHQFGGVFHLKCRKQLFHVVGVEQTRLTCGVGLVPGSEFRVQGSTFRVQGSGFRNQGSEFRVQGSGFRVQGSGCMVNSRNPLLPSA